MQGNKPVPHWVLEVQNDAARLLSPSRRESKLALSRLLPWYGPVHSPEKTREEIERILEETRALRETLAQGVAIHDLWELAQGEVAHASAFWLAELVWENPGVDQAAAVGHAALACKTHFKFAPPDFEIYPAETVARKSAEQEITREREALAGAGGEFFRALWAVHTRARERLGEDEFPPEAIAALCKRMLLDRLADPETQNDAELWKLLTKALPGAAPESPSGEPHLALHLATAWGLVREHHNFWLDRAGYDPTEAWAEPFAAELASVSAAVAAASLADPETPDAPGGAFVSIDPASAADVDDALSVRKQADGSFALSLAFACPARFWPFGGALDKAVLRRASSLYLPEGEHHMLPREAVLSLFSLLEGSRRPATILDMTLSSTGELLSFTPRLGWVTLAANLSLPGCQAILDGPKSTVAVTARQIGAAAPFAAMLREGLELAEALRLRRIANGAVITERPDPDVSVSYDEAGAATVSVCQAPDTPSAHTLVSECMILANSALAGWAAERGVPLLFRTQDVALPKEFAGIWTEPEDIARIVKHLPASGLELVPRPHAGLGAAMYAPLTSPIRRYTDLANTAQIAAFLREGEARFRKEDLAALLPVISSCSDMVAQVQRFRPRYWKLLFYKQMGDRMWWDAVVTEENDAFVSLSLPLTQIVVRARRSMLGEKISPGERLNVRLGKVDPLRNEIRVLAATEQ
jgi:exoribonuclease-2